ncbi:Similar to Caspase-1 (Spodoptera frugiperda) [Cotesia congregata]|uniref:Similar to Caspase-1 (Spodoptera frugiperda) n=1 Tax=Cotesia congregata TaxID=51543 RepID=A0A8J2EAK7_COTCN|nr:Similar to Caspase-1 (Spodoptera frugiperda) [Cotesia congregata]
MECKRETGIDIDRVRAAIYKYRSAICEAFSNHRIGLNSTFFNDKIINNAPIKTTGPFAGYTALHIAYVNAVADDGSQPIHFACLFEMPLGLIDILLEAGANVDAEISQKLFVKYIRWKRWYNAFGNEMTLLTFSILYDFNDLFVIRLIKGKANLKVKSLENKTLLMYAIDLEKNTIARSLIEEVKDHEWINACDNCGYPATHYRLYPNNVGTDLYFDSGSALRDDSTSAVLIRELLVAGTDVNATINNDPSTQLINIAARKCFPETLRQLLPYHDNTSKSTALHYLLRPLKTRKRESISCGKMTCIELILKDLLYRRTFGLFVPEDEKILMDKLIAEDIYFRELGHIYEQNIIQGELKEKVLKYDVATRDHSENDSLFIAVMSHGGKNTIYAKDEVYDSEKLWSAFTSDKCPTLTGKPKLIFYQCCRGDEKHKETIVKPPIQSD